MVRCTNCGAEGHVAWACPKPKAAQPAIAAKPVRKTAARPTPSVQHRATPAARPAAPRGSAANLTAPSGECPYCDRRRTHIREKVAKMRAAKKETKDAT